jgi:hypothetical protein
LNPKAFAIPRAAFGTFTLASNPPTLAFAHFRFGFFVSGALAGADVFGVAFAIGALLQSFQQSVDL